jgi:YbgC/YbaW family acyl-CoA thioester hydrolase
MSRGMMQGISSRKMPPFLWTTRVRFVDTDASGRIHYTALFRWFEAAEQDFLRTLRQQYSGDPAAEIGWPRVHAECDITGAFVFDDEVTIALTVSRVGNSSLELSYTASTQGVQRATGRIVMVSIDRGTQRSRPLPPDFAEALRRYLPDAD